MLFSILVIYVVEGLLLLIISINGSLLDWYLFLGLVICCVFFVIVLWFILFMVLVSVVVLLGVCVCFIGMCIV